MIDIYLDEMADNGNHSSCSIFAFIKWMKIQARAHRSIEIDWNKKLFHPWIKCYAYTEWKLKPIDELIQANRTAGLIEKATVELYTSLQHIISSEHSVEWKCFTSGYITCDKLIFIFRQAFARYFYYLNCLHFKCSYYLSQTWCCVWFFICKNCVLFDFDCEQCVSQKHWIPNFINSNQHKMFAKKASNIPNYHFHATELWWVFHCGAHLCEILCAACGLFVTQLKTNLDSFGCAGIRASWYSHSNAHLLIVWKWRIRRKISVQIGNFRWKIYAPIHVNFLWNYETPRWKKKQ